MGVVAPGEEEEGELGGLIMNNSVWCVFRNYSIHTDCHYIKKICSPLIIILAQRRRKILAATDLKIAVF